MSVDRQLVVRGAYTDMRLAESRSRPKRLFTHDTSSNVLSNGRKTSDFEGLGLDDGELLRVACASESTVPGKACGELDMSQ